MINQGDVISLFWINIYLVTGIIVRKMSQGTNYSCWKWSDAKGGWSFVILVSFLISNISPVLFGVDYIHVYARSV